MQLHSMLSFELLLTLAGAAAATIATARPE
jgi:hypothetical protein